MRWLGRTWNRIAGAPARALARRVGARLPRDEHDGVALTLGGTERESDAERFFARTRAALELAAADAPASYARLRKDVRSIVMWAGGPPRAPYHPLQLAVIVPVGIALEQDTRTYAAWLVYAAGLARDERHAAAGVQELLRGVEPAERSRVEAALAALAIRRPEP